MIVPPQDNARRAAGRVVVEALSQATPITAGLATLYRFTHPSEMQRVVEAWRIEVSDTLNDHDVALQRLEAVISPRLRIGELALELALWLAEHAQDGLKTAVDFDSLANSFPGVSQRELEEACAELEHLGFVSISAALGHAVRAVRPRYELFWTFDPVVHKTDPYWDAVELAELMLEDDRLGAIASLHERVGWSKRRLNPAVARLMPLIADGRTSKSIQNDYPTRSFSLNSEDRLRLRRLVEDSRGLKERS